MFLLQQNPQKVHRRNAICFNKNVYPEDNAEFSAVGLYLGSTFSSSLTLLETRKIQKVAQSVPFSTTRQTNSCKMSTNGRYTVLCVIISVWENVTEMPIQALSEQLSLCSPLTGWGGEGGWFHRPAQARPWTQLSLQICANMHVNITCSDEVLQAD